jgi:plastocyanin
VTSPAPVATCLSLFVHSATARDNTFDVNVTVSKSGRTVLKKGGKIAYYCRYHPNMTAEIDVVAK